MSKRFNLLKFRKIAQRQEGTPGVFEPFRRDPYRRRTPNDGWGYDRVRPGGEGEAGGPPDMGSTWMGSKDRDGYPKGVSQFEDEHLQGKDNDLPSSQDTGNEDAFSGKPSRDPFGTGTVTDDGITSHDDAGSPGDSPLGIHSTTERKLDDDNKDRAFPLGNMNSLTGGYNLERSRNDAFGRVRQFQRL